MGKTKFKMSSLVVDNDKWTEIVMNTEYLNSIISLWSSRHEKNITPNNLKNYTLFSSTDWTLQKLTLKP